MSEKKLSHVNCPFDRDPNVLPRYTAAATQGRRKRFGNKLQKCKACSAYFRK